MSIEFLKRKQQALENVTKAYRVFELALREIPEEWREELLRDIGEDTKNVPVPKHSDNGQAKDRENLLKPANAVRQLLGKHPAGLPAKEIISTLTGNIRTESTNEYKLLYSTLAVLKRNGKIIQETDGRYRLPTRHKAE